MPNEENVVQPVNQDTASNVAQQPVEQQSNVQNPDDYDFRITENGDIEISDDFFGIDSEEDNQQSKDNPQANNSNPVVEPNPAAPQAQAEPPKPQYYTDQEIATIGIDKLDPNRIPPILVPFYKSMQGDYTRKTRAIAEERKALQDRINSMNNPAPAVPPQNVNPNPQTPPQQSQTEQPSYYHQLYDLAKKNVETKLGAEFNELDPLHLTALSSEVSRIQNNVVEADRKKHELNNVVSKYSSDPRWGEMQSYVDKVLDNLPYSASKEIRNKIESGDVAYIDRFLQTAKEVFYETNGGTIIPKPLQPQAIRQAAAPVQKPVVKPPVLEGAGVGVTATPTQNRVDLTRLGSMSNDDLANLFVDMGFANETD